MRVAVVGGGIFGCTAAIELANAGHRVELFERHSDLLHGASRANQGRLHFGYHYPRSRATAELTTRCAPGFNARFPGAIDWTFSHHYAIASEGSQTSPADYLAFLESLDMEWRGSNAPGHIDWHQISLCVAVPEAIINTDRLRAIFHDELAGAEVGVNLYTTVPGILLPGFDLIVDATYGRWSQRPLQREVCEVAMAWLPAEFRGLSLVVLDGDFVSIDPVPGRAGLHRIYHVVHSVHARNVGLEAEIPSDLATAIDNGHVIRPQTHYPAMIEAASQFFPALREARYFASMFTIRAVLPDLEATDDRPTLVERDGNVISIFSGKIDTAVNAAEQVVMLAAS